MTSDEERRFVLTLDPSDDGDGWGFEVAEVLNDPVQRGREPETVLCVPRPRAARLRQTGGGGGDGQRLRSAGCRPAVPHAVQPGPSTPACAWC